MPLSHTALVWTALWLGMGSAEAHPQASWSGPQAWPLWLSWAVFASAWLLYLRGALRAHPAPHRRAAFHGGMLVAGMALFGPVDEEAAHSTAAHMLQHMLLIAVVAPLLVSARPLPQWNAAMGRRAVTIFRPALASVQFPLGWAALHGTALWIWHLPGPYTAALRHEALHGLEHACFLLTACGFWWTVSRPPRKEQGKALFALGLTLMHTGFLGALLVFSPRPLYFPESRTLEDQQLAGLLMWAPGGLVYVIAAGGLARKWLQSLRNTA